MKILFLILCLVVVQSCSHEIVAKDCEKIVGNLYKCKEVEE